MAMPLYQARGAGSGGRRATAQDAGGGEGQVAIAGGLSNLNEVGAKITDAVYTTRAARGLAQAASRIDDTVAELDTDADRDPAIDQDYYASEYDRRLSEIADEEGQNLPAQYRDVYDQKLGLYGDRGRLALTAQVQKKQINQSKAYFVDTLRQLATEESRARTPVEKAEARKEMVGLTAKMRALGLIDDAEMFKATHDYQETVWMTALNEGLAGDAGSLQVLRLRVELSDGPFADMPEEKRQAALLAITRREEGLARAAEIQQRFDVAEGRRVARQEAKAAVGAALQKAVSADPSERFTPEDLALVAPFLMDQPDFLAQLGRLAASGGRYPPGPPEKDYYGKMMKLWGDDPAAFAALPYGKNIGPGIDHLDPALLGNAWQSTFEMQRKIDTAGPAQVQSTDEAALAKWNRMEGLLKDVPLFSWLPYGALGKAELDAARADYYLRVQEEQRAYKVENKKDATGTEFTKLLDKVVLDLAEKYEDERIRGLVDVTTENTPGAVPRGTRPSPLEGISPANVELMRRSLEELNLPADDAAIRRAYDDAVDAGRLSP